MADPSVWSEVRAVVRPEIPVSVALGDLGEWNDRPIPPPEAFTGLSYRKMGLAGSGADWNVRWSDLLARFGPGPDWIAVIYSDWPIARAPEPDAVIEAAIATRCAGILIDTWDKSRPAPDLDWRALVRSIRSRVGLVALAGGWDADRIALSRTLEPDWFAVRGAACVGGDRHGAIDERRVRSLVIALDLPGRSCAARHQATDGVLHTPYKGLSCGPTSEAMAPGPRIAVE
jgi:hypothetical protein